MLVQDKNGGMRIYGPFESESQARGYAENRKTKKLSSAPRITDGSYIIHYLCPVKISTSIKKYIKCWGCHYDTMEIQPDLSGQCSVCGKISEDPLYDPQQ
jgi:hypothetical protein